MTLAHTIPMELVNKILMYRPSHPIKALIIEMYNEIKNCKIYEYDIPHGFKEDKEITLSSGEFAGWYLKTLKDNKAWLTGGYSFTRCGRLIFPCIPPPDAKNDYTRRRIVNVPYPGI